MAFPTIQMESSQFKERRQQLLASMQPNSVMILATGTEQVRSRDTHFNFRPDSDFFYLTGFTEPNAWLVLRTDASPATVIFCQPKDKEKEIWDGYRLGEKDAVSTLSIDAAYSTELLDKEMPKLLESTDSLYFPMTQKPWLDEKITNWVKAVKIKTRKGITAPKQWIDSDTLVHEMRLIKSDAEIEAIKKACQITAQAHIRAMEKCQPGLYEYQLEAEYQHEFLRQGCTTPAYSTIVGGGNNACVLHYVENCDQLKSGELVLIDAGGEFDYYAGDVTRTFPVKGQFTPIQKEIYEIVLSAQEAALAQVKPGNTFNDPHEAAVRSITQSLLDLGWIEGPIEKAIKDELYKDFYMHKTGHWLGLDVHDVGQYKVKGQWRTLEPGICMTVEPGLYIDANQTKAPEAYRGIGVRIEDDVLVTESGCEILTQKVPKTVSDIEALMQKNQIVFKGTDANGSN